MENLTLTIEKIIFGGEGLAHNKEGKAVFVKGVLPDETVVVEPYLENKNFIRGKLVQIITPSKYRIKPVCPLSSPCGGCDFGFADYDYLIKLKENIINEMFKDFAGYIKKPMIKSPLKLNYRHKCGYPVSLSKVSKRILSGYYREKTHEIINIKFCPVQPPVIDEIVDFTRNNWKFSIYNEKKGEGLLRHINTRVSYSTGDILAVFVLNIEEKNFKKKDYKGFAAQLKEKFPKIKGVLINLNPKKTNKITGDTTYLIAGKSFIKEKLTNPFYDSFYKIGADSFFQINPPCASLLFEEVRKITAQNKKGDFLDLYGGVGAIGIFMRGFVSKITLVEENKEACSLAKENYLLNKVSNYEIFEGSAKETVNKFIKEKRKFQNVVIDPPRKGSDGETLENISKMTDSIIYISCNPSTLKRDAAELKNHGFGLNFLRPVDMFPYTNHIEAIAHFTKGG